MVLELRFSVNVRNVRQVFWKLLYLSKKKESVAET